jgi:adenylate cyclase
VTRTLTAEELAADTGVPIDRVQWLVRIGVLKPKQPGRFRPGDSFKVKLIAALLEAGFSTDQIEWGVAEGNLNLDNVGRVLLAPPGPRSTQTFGQFMAEDASRGALLPAIYKVFGLPAPDPSSRISVFDEALLEQFLRAWRLAADDETPIRAARLIGEGTRLQAEGWVALFQEKVAGPARRRLIEGEVRSFPAEVSRAGTLMIRLLPRLVSWLTQQYVEQIATAGIVDGFEAILAARGLAPAPSPTAPPAVVFADLSGYTRLTEERGDEAAVRLAAALREQAETVATDLGGRLVKLLGDGAMLYFPDPGRGLLAALSLVQALGDDLGLPARAGVDAGRVIERDRDLFGRTVNLASRIVGVAEAGEVIVSASVVDAVGENGVRFDPLERKQLKGVAEPVPLYRAILQAEQEDRQR